MLLTMRPAGLSSGIDQDRADYTAFCGEWNIGRCVGGAHVGLRCDRMSYAQRQT
jgi:hypothetical protein